MMKVGNEFLWSRQYCYYFSSLRRTLCHEALRLLFACSFKDDGSRVQSAGPSVALVQAGLSKRLTLLLLKNGGGERLRKRP